MPRALRISVVLLLVALADAALAIGGATGYPPLESAFLRAEVREQAPSSAESSGRAGNSVASRCVTRLAAILLPKRIAALPGEIKRELQKKGTLKRLTLLRERLVSNPHLENIADRRKTLELLESWEAQAEVGLGQGEVLRNIDSLERALNYGGKKELLGALRLLHRESREKLEQSYQGALEKARKTLSPADQPLLGGNGVAPLIEREYLNSPTLNQDLTPEELQEFLGAARPDARALNLLYLAMLEPRRRAEVAGLVRAEIDSRRRIFEQTQAASRPDSRANSGTAIRRSSSASGAALDSAEAQRRISEYRRELDPMVGQVLVGLDRLRGRFLSLAVREHLAEIEADLRRAQHQVAVKSLRRELQKVKGHAAFVQQFLELESRMDGLLSKRGQVYFLARKTKVPKAMSARLLEAMESWRFAMESRLSETGAAGFLVDYLEKLIERSRLDPVGIEDLVEELQWLLDTHQELALEKLETNHENFLVFRFDQKLASGALDYKTGIALDLSRTKGAALEKHMVDRIVEQFVPELSGRAEKRGSRSLNTYGLSRDAREALTELLDNFEILRNDLGHLEKWDAEFKRRIGRVASATEVTDQIKADPKFRAFSRPIQELVVRRNLHPVRSRRKSNAGDRATEPVVWWLDLSDGTQDGRRQDYRLFFEVTGDRLRVKIGLHDDLADFRRY